MASCHLEVAEARDGEDPVQHNMMVARQVKEFFHREGIHSTTIQLEFSPGSRPEERLCQFECPPGSDQERWCWHWSLGLKIHLYWCRF